MVAFTDSVKFARELLPDCDVWVACRMANVGPIARHWLARLQPNGRWWRCETSPPGFDCLILVERASGSQFDVLRDAGSDIAVPCSLCCLAGSGTSFHGHRMRAWTAVPGNLHLSALWYPRCAVAHPGATFMALPAVATARAIEAASKPTGTTMIKWVNDVIVDGAKVAGVIAHTEAESDQLARVVVGVGINVETQPQVERSPFVPRIGSLRETDPKVTQQQVLACWMREMADAYATVLTHGPSALLQGYRERSLVLGRQVSIHPETAGAVVAGRVVAIGNDLELFLDGRSDPITRGRLVLDSPEGFHDEKTIIEQKP